MSFMGAPNKQHLDRQPILETQNFFKPKVLMFCFGLFVKMSSPNKQTPHSPRKKNKKKGLTFNTHLPPIQTRPTKKNHGAHNMYTCTPLGSNSLSVRRPHDTHSKAKRDAQSLKKRTQQACQQQLLLPLCAFQAAHLGKQPTNIRAKQAETVTKRFNRP